MSSRHLAIIGMLFAAVVVASLCAVLTTPQIETPSDRSINVTNPLIGKPNMVDRLDMFDTPAELDRATMQHVALVLSPSPRYSGERAGERGEKRDSKNGATSQPSASSPSPQPSPPSTGEREQDRRPQLILADQRLKSFPRSGTWTSDVTDTAFAFTELIPSWNLTTPHDTGVMFHVKTRDAQSHEWSPWLYMGQWGRTPITDPADHVVSFDRGVVHVDNLTLDAPADAYQIRATLLSFSIDRAVNPSIRRITVSYSGQVDDPEERQRLIREVKIDGDWARSLPVPFRAQGIEAKPLAGQVCSPTSTSMVMEYCGVNLPTQENALAIYDEEHDMFGNWGRAVQRAGELGLDAWLQRFRNWDQVKAMIAKGQPIVAGIKFKNGEFPSALYKETAGHLIVIRGFTKDGDVIVNDPADRNKGNGVVYKADELGNAWFGHGGVGYVIRKPEGFAATSTRPPATMPTVVAK